MSESELKELAQDIPGAGKPDSDQAKNGSQEPGPMPNDPAQFLVIVCSRAVHVLGTLVTRRAKVDPLTPEESAELGLAMATVAAQYDISKLSPKAAAWLGLGIAVAGVAMPRIEQASKTIEGEAEPAPDPEGEGDHAPESDTPDGWPESAGEA